MTGFLGAQGKPCGDAARRRLCIVPAATGKAMRLEQREPFGAVEGRGEVCGRCRIIISAIFTVPIHAAALYQLSPNSR
ncbi:hypothetical protein GCM10009115_18040 [Sphingopyxis soli]|uniref:Uncharacterized protein n=1 Tax=Sphingopyxis soli TaxID=592051 RepID=A0ABP3XF04_9SPHN